MSIPLSDLVSRVTAAVPAHNSTPTSAQYTQCVRDAVADFSFRASRIRVTTISVVSGTADYALPSDFVRLVSFPQFTAEERTLVTAEGLIPLSETWQETISIRNGILTITPTPSYTMTRELTYGAGWVLNDAGEAYEDMTEAEAGIVSLGAQARALNLLANALALETWRYRIGDEQVDKTPVAEAVRTQAAAMQAQYEAAVQRYLGQIVALEADA